MELKIGNIYGICEKNESTIKEILYKKSEILVGKEKYWELIRRVYNCKFNKASKDKEEKEMINELWNFCFNELKKKFWIKGCNEINEIEQNLGIKKCEKRVRKIVDRDVYKEENTRKKLKNNEKIKNREYNIKLVTKDKIIGRFTEGKDTKSWNVISLAFILE
ncbi:hypothetical protein GLOIN_2v1791673 [Rhizophagus irregularis DAOM 181602=DAOM 197198]|uniref:Uncharacterized protein n=3 Tax=Rhizophagus irregularis TaxID=588596 RepID=A0A015JPW8_RHIIW|nr:hypothetical protein GLOIN_2v1791673 [Rhizophagus irregularis DAOM 181602=DAOM 197198]EXX69305.1 hypothetical protein RirG_097350 [Rhizophagus irregularis DAOM 197198w]POG57271.1 hypothetical protein GLOIN_2v1791673 [Rhizophagus irregularis DAOM 181602=DAOM 197198]|eukprot:XP_025164412.1 hypothetical protein GLOIN_2v1791673 [Rhizophagus irregularis DAOM 181602=DAOM 197198]